MEESKPIGGKILTKPFMVLMVFALVAAYYLAKRFIYGIGAVTNMNDGYAWGIWIAYDVVVGTALGCGGYAMAILVYVLNKGEYHPLIRPAVLTSLFGYTMAAVSVFVDIGRYWQMYNVFLPQYINVNSVLLEVALCIALYTGVLWIEMAPAYLEQTKADNLRKTLNKFIFVFIALGILLPTMHQSSLGSVLLIAGSKLSPLWHTGFLPLLFIISVVTMGYSTVVLESVISSVGLKRPFETPILRKIAGIIPWLIAVYLAIRFGDLLVRGQLGLAFKGDLKGNMFLLENILYIIPMLMLFAPSGRAKPQSLFISSALMLLAGAIYRFNAYLVGFNPGTEWLYFPSFGEIMITLGIISIEIMGYLIIVKKVPVLPDLRHA